MIDYRVLVAAVAFLLVLLWRFRPDFSNEEVEPPVLGLDTAKTDPERAELLFAAGENFALRLGGARKAAACFTRAMRLVPASHELVTRASRALRRHPKLLEALLWRRLGAGPWVDGEREVAKVALRELVTIYDATSRTRPRARALEQVLVSLGGSGGSTGKSASEASGESGASEPGT